MHGGLLYLSLLLYILNYVLSHKKKIKCMLSRPLSGIHLVTKYDIYRGL